MISDSPQVLYENYLKKQEHNAVKRFRYKDKEVYISAGGPYYTSDYPSPGVVESDLNLKSTFWYEATYAIGHDDKIIFWQPLIFDGLHDIHSLSVDARQMARINAAIQTAKEVIDGTAMFLENYAKDSKDTKALIQDG